MHQVILEIYWEYNSVKLSVIMTDDKVEPVQQKYEYRAPEGGWGYMIGLGMALSFVCMFLHTRICNNTLVYQIGECILLILIKSLILLILLYKRYEINI